jgi:succinoglycan biosynthesis protein ExoA
MYIHRILVVIPTLNEARHIEKVLRDLHTDLPADAQTDFVVCDGGSSDQTVDIVESLMPEMPTLCVLHNPKRLQSAAVNLAVERLGDGVDLLIRCDAHAGYPRGYVAELAASIERNGADAVVVPMDSEGRGRVQRVVGWVSDSFLGSGGSAHRAGRSSGFVDHGHHAAFRMASFRRAGGYDESYSHNEDAELDCRQRAIGSRIYLDAAIRITYHPRDSLQRLWRQYFAYGRGRSRTIRRHPDSWRLRQLAVPVHAGLLAASVAASVATPWALAWPAAYAGVLGAAALSIAAKRGTWQGLWAAPVAATIHLGWGAGFLHGLLTLREPAWRTPPTRSSRNPAGAPKVPA